MAAKEGEGAPWRGPTKMEGKHGEPGDKPWDDLEALLAESDEEESVPATLPDWKDLLAQQALDFGRKKWPFVRHEVVWRLYIFDHRTRRERNLQPRDWNFTSNEFCRHQRELRGYLCVVKSPQLGRGARAKRVGVLAVDNGQRFLCHESLAMERVPQRQLFKYKRFYDYNQAISSRIVASQRALVDPQGLEQCENARLALLCQWETVKEYFRLHTERPGIEGLQFLVMNRAERRLYLSPETSKSTGLLGLGDAQLAVSSPPLSTSDHPRANSETLDGATPIKPSTPPSRPVEPSPRLKAIVAWFKTNRAKSFLSQIMTAQVDSRRHRLFTGRKCQSLSLRDSPLLRLTSTGFFEDNDEIIIGLHKYLENNVIDRGALQPFIRRDVTFIHHYIEHCLVPEGVIKFLQEHLRLSVDEARKAYLAPTSS